jgi:peptidoglycan/xylan/chitin deacetylase (PgdA/CDA1 family)
VSLQASLKSLAPALVRYSGVGQALALRYAGPGVIFLLHSVVDDFDRTIESSLRCPAQVLGQILGWLKADGVALVSLDEALERLRGSSSEKFCVFTFDDGYADNFTHLLPIMERFAAPFTVYVTSGMLTGEIDAWWLGLAALIEGRDHLELPALDVRFDCADRADKKNTFLAVESLVHTREDALAAVKRAIAEQAIDCGALARRQALTKEQLRQLAGSPLVTIGAHGERHIKLASVAASEVVGEVTASRRFLEEIIGREVVHFAYPFGDTSACGVREMEIIRAAGYRTAVTTRRGTLFPEHLSHLHALPREPLLAHETPSTLRCKRDGTYRAFHSRFGDPVALM